jgi:hypothetical protein
MLTPSLRGARAIIAAISLHSNVPIATDDTEQRPSRGATDEAPLLG